MNKHIIFDKLTASAGSLIAGKKKFFACSLQSQSFEQQIAAAKLVIPSITGEGSYELKAETLTGVLDPAFRVARWKGLEYPTIIYHHGNNERPFNFKKSAKNSFYNIFLNTSDSVEANLVVVRAPFHNCRLSCYQEKMTELKNFVVMISTSVQLNEALIQYIRGESEAPVITTGISLGGWVTNLHRAFFNTSTAYAPLMAGTYLGELFLESKYRKMTSETALNNPEEIRKVLNFDEVFKRRNSQNLFPLLSKYDQYIEYDVQGNSYTGYPVKTIEGGHVTGAINTDELRAHLLSVLETTGS